MVKWHNDRETVSAGFFWTFLHKSCWTFLDNSFSPVFNQMRHGIKQDGWSHGWISSKTDRKVVQKGYAVLYRPFFPFPFVNIHNTFVAYYKVCSSFINVFF